MNIQAKHPFTRGGKPFMKIDRIDHFVLTVKDIEKTMRFYTDALGMEPVAADGRYAVKFGGQKINFHRAKGEFLPAAQNPVYGGADFCLITGDPLEAVERQLKEKGVTPETGIVRRTGAAGPIDSIYVRDPDGNLVEISSYPQKPAHANINRR
jgi:catechol 2,3-dioxygenase-like lactoylglutathione lyase family enzyme